MGAFDDLVPPKPRAKRENAFADLVPRPEFRQALGTLGLDAPQAPVIRDPIADALGSTPPPRTLTRQQVARDYLVARRRGQVPAGESLDAEGMQRRLQIAESGGDAADFYTRELAPRGPASPKGDKSDFADRQLTRVADLAGNLVDFPADLGDAIAARSPLASVALGSTPGRMVTDALHSWADWLRTPGRTMDAAGFGAPGTTIADADAAAFQSDRSLFDPEQSLLERGRTVANAVPWAVGASIPDMAAAIGVPIPYFMSLLSDAATERARNDGRDAPTLIDFLIVAPGQAAQIWLERSATKAFFKPLPLPTGVLDAGGRIGGSAVFQAGTEAGEEVLDLASRQAGTERGVTSREVREAGLGGVLAGAPMAAVQAAREGMAALGEPNLGVQPSEVLRATVRHPGTTQEVRLAAALELMRRGERMDVKGPSPTPKLNAQPPEEAPIASPVVPAAQQGPALGKDAELDDLLLRNLPPEVVEAAAVALGDLAAPADPDAPYRRPAPATPDPREAAATIAMDALLQRARQPVSAPPATTPLRGADPQPPQPAVQTPRKPAVKSDAARKPMDLLRVLAANGGLNREAFRRQGVDPAEFTRRAGFNYLFRKQGGMSPGDMREFMQQEGYLPRDPENAPPIVDDNDAYDLFDRAFRSGEEVYADDQMADLARYRAEREAADEEFRAEVQALPEFDDTDPFEPTEITDAIARLTEWAYDLGATDEEIVGAAFDADNDDLHQEALTAIVERLERNDSDASPAGRIGEGRAEARQETESGPGFALEAADAGAPEANGRGIGGSRTPAIRHSDRRAEEVTPQGLFGAPTAREFVDDLSRRKDARRDGKTADAPTPSFAGTALGAGVAPEQGDVATGQLPAQDVSRYGDTRPLSTGPERGGIASPDATAAGRRGPATLRGQLDLFVATRGNAEPGTGQEPAIRVNRSRLSQSVGLAQIGQFRSGHAVIDSLAKAAHVLAPLRKSAQEQFLALVLDADGKPLGVIRHTVGRIDESLVDVGAVFGAIASIPGAKSVVFGHNHPSGTLTSSAGDRAVDARLRNLMGGSGIEVMGAVIVVPGDRRFAAYRAGGAETQAQVEAAGRTQQQVPSLERRLTRVAPNQGKQRLADPVAAARHVEQEAKGRYPSGVVLLDNQHNIIGTKGMTRGDMRPLRTGDSLGIADLARDVTGANAAAAIVYGHDMPAMLNVAKALSAMELRVLDIFEIDTDGKATSMAAKGRVPSKSDNVFESVEYADDADILSDADLTPEQRASFDRQRVDRSGVRARLSQQQGEADADANGLRAAVQAVVGDVVPIRYLRGNEGLRGLVTEGFSAQLSDQQRLRGTKLRTSGLYITAEQSATGEPFVALFTDVLTSPELAAFTAAHEIAGHHGLRSLLGDSLDNALAIAEQNPIVSAVADSMMRRRKMAPGKRMLAIEEALADLAAATRTGDYASIESRHGVTVPHAQRNTLRGAIARFIERLKALFGKRGAAFTDAQVRDLLESAWQAGQGEAGTTGADALESTESITDSPAFRRWFGDSRVVDAEGKPLVVYHGTDATPFEVFDRGKGGSGPSKFGFWFTNQDSFAEMFGGNLMPVYVKAENPKRISLKQWNGIRDKHAKDGEWFNRWREELLAQGHDGLVVAGGTDQVGRFTVQNPDVVAVFEPTQVKSATANRGTFDPASPSILESVEYTPAQESALAKAGLRVDTRSTLGKARDRLREEWTKVREAARDTDALKQATFDRFHGLRMAEAQLGLSDPETSPYVAARMSAGIASNVEGLMLYGAPKWDGGILALDPETKGLLDALKQVEGRIDEFLGWMVGRRAKLLKAQGRENNLTDADIAALLSLADGREAAFQQAAKDYLKIKNAVLDVAEQAGLIDPVARAAWDHAEYIPFYRAENDGVIGPGTRKGLAGQTSGIRTLKGGENALADPLANIVRNFSKLIDAANKNRATLLAVDQLGATFFRPAAREMQPATIPMDQVKRHLQEQGVSEAVIGGMPTSALRGVQRMLSIVPPIGEDVVRVMRAGKAEYWQVLDPLVLRALTAFKAANKNIAIKPFIWFKRLLTTGVTTTAEFVGANFIRDSGSAWIISDDRFIPGWDSLKGIGNTLRNDPGTRDMMMAGATFLGGNFYDGNADAAAAALRRALRQKGVKDRDLEGFIGTIARSPLQLWDVWMRLSGAVENANRRAVYEAALKAGRSRTEAAYMARDLMDFSMQGDSAFIQFFADVLPFFNARLQGMYKLGRRAGTKEGRRAIVLRGGVLTLASAALYAWNISMHADAYDELEEWDKDAYWHIAPGTEYHVRIPKPFELGLIFGTAPERMMQAIRMATTGDGDTPSATWDALVRGLTGTLAMNPIPQAVLPPVEQWANKRFFTGRPIENMGDEKMLPEARAEWYSSDTMKAISRIAGNETGLSPKRLEHLWNGYTAGLGGYVLDATDAAVRMLQDAPERPEMAKKDWWALGRFLRGGSPGNSKYTEQFYDRLREAEQVEQTIKEYTALGRTAEAAELAKENADLLGERIASKRAKGGFRYAKPKAMGKVREQLSGLREQMEDIALDRKLSAHEKRVKIDELTAKRNRLVKDAVKG